MHYIWKYKLDHIAFWLVTVLFYAFVRKDLIYSSGLLYYLADVIIRNLLIAVICYVNIYYLFVTHFKKGRYLLYAGMLLMLSGLYAMLQNSYDWWFYEYMKKNSDGHLFFHNTYYHFSIGIFYLAFTLALELSKRWYRQQLLLHQMQMEKLETELMYLKAQMNPHFLFNSINTIYFQIDKANIAARESLEKFSELLRYQLYECNDDQIPVEKEVSYLESYVALQRLRRNSNNSILFNVGSSVRHFTIAPLLLLPFVENAFKHLSDYANSNNSIELTMSRQNGYFIFHIINSIGPGTRNDNGPGIGLKNVKRRLDLLYENRYKLEIRKDASSFSVELKIQVA